MPGSPSKQIALSRTDAGPRRQTTNTTLTLRLVRVDYEWGRVADIAIEQYAPGVPVNHSTESFRCVPGSTSLFWRSQACPTGKAVLAAGLVQGSNNLLDIVGNTLGPLDNSLAWAAQAHNRNTVAGGGPVDVSLAAVSVRRQ